jgi:hypothetical protein
VDVTKQRKHVLSRRAEGLCAREGCEVVTGSDYRCEEHAKEHAASKKAAYWAKREQRARAA